MSVLPAFLAPATAASSAPALPDDSASVLRVGGVRVDVDELEKVPILVAPCHGQLHQICVSALLVAKDFHLRARVFLPASPNMSMEY